jgi:hypothetical protein
MRASIDPDQWTLLSMSGYKGTKPIIGAVGESGFWLQKRRYTRNDFAGRFFARFDAEPGGTRIEGYFDCPSWARWFMRIWFGMAILIGTPMFIGTLWSITTRGYNAAENDWLGVVVPPALVLYGIFVPKLGRLLGKSDERLILEHLQTTLAARLKSPDSFDSRT